MKFKTVAEAFNYYRNKSVADLEARAKEINNIIDTDANADIEALNIELRGMKEARENIELRSADQAAGLNMITGRDLKGDDVKKFEGDDVAGTKEYRSAFYKTLMGRKLTPTEAAAFKAVVEKRSDEFNNSTNAAAVLPTTTLNEVLKKARTMGGLIAEARAFNMPTKISIPIATPSANASWHTEGDPVDTEKVGLAKVSFDGYEIIKIFSISAKVQTMSIDAFESYLADELTACVMGTIEDALVNGTGSSQGTGLEAITWTEGTNLISVDTTSITGSYYSFVVDTAALLPRGYAKGAKWAMNNKTLYSRFYGCMDDNGRALLINNPQTDAINFVLGFPVVVDDNIADDEVYLGNYNKYLGYNMPGGITLESSRESSFKSGLIDYRAMAVADCKPLIDEAFVKLVFETE